MFTVNWIGFQYPQAVLSHFKDSGHIVVGYGMFLWQLQNDKYAQ